MKYFVMFLLFIGIYLGFDCTANHSNQTVAPKPVQNNLVTPEPPSLPPARLLETKTMKPPTLPPKRDK